jgi:U3 small nucleolar ribonucleoprotein protein LCP5
MQLASTTPTEPKASASSALNSTLSSPYRASDISSPETELAGELVLQQEMMDKVRGLELKLEYQIRKLAGLAEAEEARGAAVVDDVEEGMPPLPPALISDPLSFRPNASALLATGDRVKVRETDSEAVYRPPRVAAVPYSEGKSQRTDRRAPALLSEFATTMDGAPVLETTSGLSTRPVQTDRHTNSKSAKRAAELKRINDFEEENMTRLVTTKREGKRRREDEQALAMGYGIGTGRARGSRQNGLEAELEGVLGDRRAKGLWEGVSSKLGTREGLLQRGRGATIPESRPQKAKFERAVKGASRPRAQA